MNFTMTKIAAALILTAAAAGAQAASVSSGGVFTMYSGAGNDTAGVVPGGGIVGVDATLSGFVDQAAGTWGVSSSTAFFGFQWTASGGVLITTAGSYSLDTATNVITAIASPTVANDGKIQFTVGANQVAGAINFDWNTTTGIRVVDVWNVNANGSLTAAVVPAMENGSFPGFNAAFNLSAPGLITPVPEASTYGMMLAGLGLVGFAVRRRNAS
ncbi:MAG: PEP-CTERM sorting domain-containing protein [Thiobacillus sp.]